jgi:hypothetical protein
MTDHEPAQHPAPTSAPRQVDVLLQDALQVSPTEDEQPVQALAPRRPDPPLGVGVGARCPVRCADHAGAPGAEHVVERAGELGIAIADEHRRREARLVQIPGEVAGLLGHPRCGRLRAAAGDEHPSGVDFDDEEHVQGL